MHCADHTKQALLKIQDVKKVKVDLEKGEATVVSTRIIENSEFKEAISSVGFELVEVK